jgi:hypothetical protein
MHLNRKNVILESTLTRIFDSKSDISETLEKET